MKTIIHEKTGEYASYEDGEWVTHSVPKLWPDTCELSDLLKYLKDNGIADLNPEGYRMIDVKVTKVVQPSQIRELSLDELKSRYEDFLTVKRLKEKLANYPDDAKVLVQRVEDSYYEEHHWGVVKKKGEFYYNNLDFNDKMREEIKNRAEGKESQYDKIKDPNDYIISEEDNLEYLEQYHPVFCVAGFGDDKENLYLNLHY